MTNIELVLNMLAETSATEIPVAYKQQQGKFLWEEIRQAI